MAGGFVFHVEKMPGVLQADKLAVGNRSCKVPGVAGHGVFVPLAIDKQHRYLDTLGGPEKARRVAAQDVLDMKVHLRVFMLGQAADVPEVETLE